MGLREVAAQWHGIRPVSYTHLIYPIGSDTEVYSSLTSDGENIWLLTEDNKKIISWNRNSKLVREYPFLFEKQCFPPNAYRYCFYYKKYIWMFPALGEKILLFNTVIGQVEKEVPYPCLLYTSRCV